ncbi:hypothetical protein V2J09_023893 [Rumex salicifolius]
MRKMALLRSLYRSSTIRSLRFATISGNQFLNGSFGGEASRTFFSLSQPSTSSISRRDFLDCKSPFYMGTGSARSFSADISAYPDIKDPEIVNVFKDFMATGWDELPHALIHDAVNVLSKDSDDKVGKEVLTNVFRSAEAVEEFTGILVSLRMELDDSLGISGENVKPMSDEFANAIRVVYNRYKTYLDSFGPDETYLKKKVESELGTRMIHLKLRCSGIGAEWGKVTVLGTSGISVHR